MTLLSLLPVGSALGMTATGTSPAACIQRAQSRLNAELDMCWSSRQQIIIERCGAATAAMIGACIYKPEPLSCTVTGLGTIAFCGYTAWNMANEAYNCMVVAHANYHDQEVNCQETAQPTEGEEPQPVTDCQDPFSHGYN